MRYNQLLLAALLAIALPAAAVNTMPNCGTVPGSLMPDVDISGYMATLPGDTAFKANIPDTTQIPVQNLNTGQVRYSLGTPVGQSNNDPIVYPGIVGAAHSHTFYGNPDFVSNVNIDFANVQKPGCASAAVGGSANCSGYWVPSIIDTSTNLPVPQGLVLAYYKTGGKVTDTSQVVPPPAGLRMITGFPKGKTIQPRNNKPIIRFFCEAEGVTTVPAGEQRIPACPQGGKIKSQITFPHCWDGVNLDSADHQSHMAFAYGACLDPAYPVRIPDITLIWWTQVTGINGTQYWRLASDNYAADGYNAGYSQHADWVNGWKPEIMQLLVDTCLNAKLDCHASLYTPGLKLGF